MKEKVLVQIKHRENSLRRRLEEAEMREERQKLVNERRKIALDKSIK
jgi:hypothetical protein